MKNQYDVKYTCDTCGKVSMRSIAGWEIECQCGGWMLAKEETLLDKLKAFRKKKRWSQSMMADSLGISRQYYGLIEAANRKIPARIMKKIESL